MNSVRVGGQDCAPGTLKSFICNRHTFFQAVGCRFDPGLPLHLPNNLRELRRTALLGLLRFTGGRTGTSTIRPYVRYRVTGFLDSDSESEQKAGPRPVPLDERSDVVAVTSE